MITMGAVLLKGGNVLVTISKDFYGQIRLIIGDE